MNHHDVIVSAVRTPIGRIRGAAFDVRRMTCMLVIKAALARAAASTAAGGRGLPGVRQPGGRGQPQRGAHGIVGVTGARLPSRGRRDGQPALRQRPQRVNQAAPSSAARATSSWPARGEHDARACAPPKNPVASGPSGNVTGYDTILGWRFPQPGHEAIPLEAMGETAENIYELSVVKARFSRRRHHP
ncbi:MAG: hypothetical protein R2838_20180 [Caldilineaceae bacterium]